MSMNKDLVAQAVAAIPLWIAFLDQKEAEEDALLEKMQAPQNPSFMEKATLRPRAVGGTSRLKKKEDNSQSPSPPEPSQPDPPNSTDEAKEEMRWAPTEEEATIVDNQKEEDQYSNIF